MSDNDLISREAAPNALLMSKNYRDAHDSLEQLPAVDAVPVVHAYWWYEDLDGIWLCSHCNSGESVVRRQYCPDCGARMDADSPTCGSDYCEIGGEDDAR